VLLKTSTLKEGTDVAGREKTRGNTESKKYVASTAFGRKGTVIRR
jgi:hypothetical protein